MLRLRKGATLLQLASAQHVTWRSTWRMWATMQPLAARCAHSAATGPTEVDDSAIYDSVVKIYSTSLRPNFWQPWQLRGQNESSGSGFAISDSLILTNAHVVADNAFATGEVEGGGAALGGRAPPRRGCRGTLGQTHLLPGPLQPTYLAFQSYPACLPVHHSCSHHSTPCFFLAPSTPAPWPPPTLALAQFLRPPFVTALPALQYGARAQPSGTALP